MQHADKLTLKAEAYLLQHGGVKMALEYLEEISKSDQLYQDSLAREKDRVAMQLARSGALEEGMKAGELNKARKIALNMLQKGSEVPFISEVTGLSVVEIEQLNHRTAD